ncbi:MAG: DNRLRE domain-containing protein [Chlamydiae bacterium]|nr:DNRLRE domain-containing protein [Chlamydiota bacterium]MBI3265667.1 DNRLRE domain-containing protein [Chlamydiota bacterium]
MKTYLSPWWLVTLFFFLVPQVSPLASDLKVPLQVENDLNIDRTDEYVTSGVPVPKDSQLFSTHSLNILDESGGVIPSQVIVTARWGGVSTDTSKPIKWILATFPVHVSPLSKANYFLISGSSNQTSSNLKVVSDTADAMVIDTGKAVFSLNKKNFNLLSSVTVRGQPIATGGGISLLDDQGALFDSLQDAPKTFSIEEQGALRIVLKVEGSLKSTGGASKTDYLIYIYFYSDQSYARMIYTIGNHNNALQNSCCGYDVFNYYGINSITFRELSVSEALDQPSGSLSYLFPTGKGDQSGAVSGLNVYQDSSGTSYWNRYNSTDNPRPNSDVQFKGYEVRNGSTLVDSGNHFSGWLDLSDSSKGVTMGMIDFWQNFPKGLSASPSASIRLNLFPVDYAGLYNFRVGEEKTTDLFFYFHSGDANAAHVSDVAQGLAHPMMALAPADVYSSSKAVQEFTSLAGSLEDRYGQWANADDRVKFDYYNDRTLLADPLYKGIDSDYYIFSSLWLSTSDKPSSVDYFDFYGWTWYGDQPLDFESYGDGKAGPFDVKYNFDFGAWIQFLRTGDFRWEEMASAFSKHLELLMLHDVVTLTDAYGPTDVSRWQNAVFGMSQHNETGNSNSVRNGLGPVMDTAFGARGSLLHYYLTGYPESRRFLEKIGDYAYHFFTDNPGIYENVPYLEDSGSGTRTFANFLTIMVEAFKYSGDLKYQKLAKQVMDHFAPEKQPWINGPVAGNAGFMQPMFFMQYVNAMARYAQVADEFGMSQESNLAKQRVVAFMDWFLKYAVIKPYEWYSTWYKYYYSGNNPLTHDDGTLYDDMVNNWMLVFADACAYAYAFTLNPTYIHQAKEFFRTGVNNPFYRGSPLTYATAKEAVNHLVNGHVYLYYQKFYDNLPPDSEPPVITITNPVSNAMLSGAVDLTVNATDNVGIQKVSYFLEGQELASTWLSPFSYSWNTVGTPNGSDTLLAKAYDYANNETVSAPISLTIANIIDIDAPSCTILSPQQNEFVRGVFLIEVQALDNVGIQKVECYVDDKSVGTLTKSPYSFSLDSSQYTDGTHFIQAKATDTSNLVGQSQKIEVMMDHTNQAPVAILTFDTSLVYQIEQAVAFDGSQSTDSDGDPLTYSWSFGDNASGNGASTSHAYQVEGNYVVELTVSDGKVPSKTQAKIAIYPKGKIYTIILQQGPDYSGAQDALIRASYEGNYGGSTQLQIYNGYNPDYRALMKFDLGSVTPPQNAIFVSSQLMLFCTSTDSVKNNIYRLTKSWKEGTGTYGNTFNGATWNTFDGVSPWTLPGADLDLTTDFGEGPNGLVSSVTPVKGSVTFDVSSLVSKGLTGELENDGWVVLMPDDIYYSQTAYVSKEGSDVSERPKLVMNYLIPSAAPVDDIPPQCELISPTDGAMVSGKIDIAVNATDNVAIQKVTYVLNDQEIGTQTATPYSLTFDTAQVPDGSYILIAKAYDTAGNQTPSSPVTFFIYQGKNLVLNPQADENLQYWKLTSGAKASVVTFENDKVFATTAGSLYQDIVLKNIPNINSGRLQITLSSDMKAQKDNQDQGNPYLYGYLVGTLDNFGKITTYMQTPSVRTTAWQVKQVTYTLPAYTNKMRIYLKRSSKNKSKTTNPTAYFDTVSVKIG